VCGNEEAINFLSDWLDLWHKRLYQSRKSSSNKGQSKRQDDGADSEDIHESPLQSVLLVTGPIGVRENLFLSKLYLTPIYT